MTPHTIDREEVMAYLDGELEQARRALIEGHLDECDDCRTLANELREVSVRLSQWNVAGLPGEMPAVRAGLATINPHASSWWAKRAFLNVPRWAVGAGIVAVAGVALLTPAMHSRREFQSMPIELAEGRSSVLSRQAPVQAGGGGGGQVQGQGQGQLRQAATPPARDRESRGLQATDRMIVRSATIVLTSDKFDEIRGAIERLVAAHKGRVTSLNLTGEPSSRRSLNATLGVPAAAMDAVLGGLRGLGRVQDESLGSDDVTENFRDLGIRTANARREEQRLVELLAKRTGDLADVLAVERELARVRLDIERMEAETRAVQQRVDLATVSVTVNEQYRADLAIGRLPLPIQFKNALVDGSRNAAESVVGASLALLMVAPTLLIWGLLLAWPVRWVWRRMRVGIP